MKALMLASIVGLLAGGGLALLEHCGEHNSAVRCKEATQECTAFVMYCTAHGGKLIDCQQSASHWNVCEGMCTP